MMHRRSGTWHQTYQTSLNPVFSQERVRGTPHTDHAAGASSGELVHAPAPGSTPNRVRRWGALIASFPSILTTHPQAPRLICCRHDEGLSQDQPNPKSEAKASARSAPTLRTLASTRFQPAWTRPRAPPLPGPGPSSARRFLRLLRGNDVRARL